eukprot:1160964-Pelagomonas_calceolata.AAC.3
MLRFLATWRSPSEEGTGRVGTPAPPSHALAEAHRAAAASAAAKRPSSDIGADVAAAGRAGAGVRGAGTKWVSGAIAATAPAFFNSRCARAGGKMPKRAGDRCQICSRLYHSL